MLDEKMELSAAFVHNFSSDFTYFFYNFRYFLKC
uniref:Uncharacterized protein n=1 Tax=Wuchereria bancrofti TaxID=6293 RepID=A0AAF5PTY4_WUCBA